MLVISRKKGESLLIGDDIEITVEKIDSSSVKISIKAPKEKVILRKEVYEKVKNELEKAGFKVGIPRAGIDGKTTNNIVNRGLTKAGCQLEITRAQRALFFANKSLKSPRTKRSEILYKYSECLRNALND